MVFLLQFSLRAMLAALLLACIVVVPNRVGASSEAYIISVGDELEFDNLDDNEPPQRFFVGREGGVQLPFIGSVTVGAISLGDARSLIRRIYVEREIFVDPHIELSIANFRPISVLGDVKNPGIFDYQPQMSAEQAVGMAGGPAISVNNEEARVLERRTLEGTLNSLQFDLALLAAQYARAQAQLNGEDSVVLAGVPPQIRAAISRETFEEHRTEEDRIIALEAQGFAARRKLLTEAIDEATNGIAILSQREAVLQKILDHTEKEAARIVDLADRGLVPKSDVPENLLEVARAENEILQLREQISADKVQYAELRGQLSRFDTENEQLLLTQKQTALSEINKAMSSRNSLEDQLRLLRQWMSAASGLQTELLLEFQVRRRAKTGTQNINVGPSDELLPGDVLVIIVKPPEALGQPG